MTGLLDVKTPRSPQGLKREISLVFSEPDREIGERIHESLMRSGFTVTEKPDSVGGGNKQAGTVLYLASASTPKAIAAAAPKAAPEGVRRQLTIWRSLCAAATIGLISFIAVSGTLYQQNQSVSHNLKVAIEQKDSAIAAKKQMNDKLYVANVTADRALQQKDRAIAERQQMNSRLYQANVTTDRALREKTQAIAQREQMNDKLYAANVKADKATKGEQEAKYRSEQLQKELDKSNQRVDLLEELLRNRPIQGSQTSP